MNALSSRRLFALVFACSTLLASQLSAVTVYRIGAESMAPPDLGSDMEILNLTWDDLPAPAPVEGVSRFIQLPWAGTVEERFGASNLVELGESITPLFLDPDVNLTPSIKERGGSIQSTDGYTFKDEDALDFMFDEDPNTAYSGGGSHFSWGRYKIIEINLGGALPISRIVLYPTPAYADQRLVREMTIAVNDGDGRKDGLRGTGPSLNPWEGGLENRNVQYARAYSSSPFRDWTKEGEVLSTTENRQANLDLEVRSSPTQGIFIIAPVGDWEIAEFEIYGEGFVPQSSYRSNILDLGQLATMGDVIWAGSREENVVVDLTARSGDTPDPNQYWRHTFRGDEVSNLGADGKLLTRALFEKLETGEQAGITPDTGNWQFWSTPFEFEGGTASLNASRPRQYVQFDVDMQTASVTSGSRFDYFEFRVASPPVVNNIVAEISPKMVQPRTPTQFRYLVLPKFEDGDQGFDSIEIETSTTVTGVDSVRIKERYLDDSEWDWVPGESSFVVKLPRIDVGRTNELIEIVFRSEVYKYGTVFGSRVFDGTKPAEPAQIVTAGDADELADSNSLSVGLTDLGERALQALELSSPVVTPNGDGVNDDVEISFDLVNLSGLVPVTLSLYDLAGRKVADAFEGVSTSGHQSVTWDGSIDGNGTRAVPGVYILRLDIDIDDGSSSTFGIVSLAY